MENSTLSVINSRPLFWRQHMKLNVNDYDSPQQQEKSINSKDLTWSSLTALLAFKCDLRPGDYRLVISYQWRCEMSLTHHIVQALRCKLPWHFLYCLFVDQQGLLRIKQDWVIHQRGELLFHTTVPKRGGWGERGACLLWPVLKGICHPWNSQW